MAAKRGRGRPSKYDALKHIPAVLSAECLSDGATWTAIGKACEVATSTAQLWAETHADFSVAVKAAKDIVDDGVEQAFLENANGGAIKSATLRVDGGLVIEYHKPDTTAGIFWLCNRRGNRWRHVQRVEHTGADGKPIEHSDVTQREQVFAEAEGILRRAEIR